jgi:hypothetical protein
MRLRQLTSWILIIGIVSFQSISESRFPCQHSGASNPQLACCCATQGKIKPPACPHCTQTSSGRDSSQKACTCVASNSQQVYLLERIVDAQVIDVDSTADLPTSKKNEPLPLQIHRTRLSIENPSRQAMLCVWQT